MNLRENVNPDIKQPTLRMKINRLAHKLVNANGDNDYDAQIISLCMDEDKSDVWLIFFEDTEVESEIFSGEGVEAAAKKRFEACQMNWSCHLFRNVKVIKAIENLKERQ